jgi:uncharacterized surface protein with fasciclin (FAS1) repeats
MRTTRYSGVAGAAGCALALAVAGCGMGGASANGAAAPTHHPMHHPMHHEMAARFGSDCGMVPATGMGSFHGMSTEPVLTAAAHNPLLTTFAAEARKAGLATTLNSAHGITIFAPENSAFAKLGHSAMMMLDNTADLARILKYHVVAGQVTAAQLASGHALTTMEGETVTPAKMGAVYEVNKAAIICGNITTANATVDIINSVLIPMHMHG